MHSLTCERAFRPELSCEVFMRKKQFFDLLNNLVVERDETIQSINSLPKGYIQVKTVSGHQYSFRQWREDGTVKSEYVNESFVPLLKRKIQLRKSYSDNLKEINKEIKRLTSLAIKTKLATKEEVDAIILNNKFE